MHDAEAQNTFLICHYFSQTLAVLDSFVEAKKGQHQPLLMSGKCGGTDKSEATAPCVTRDVPCILASGSVCCKVVLILIGTTLVPSMPCHLPSVPPVGKIY